MSKGNKVARGTIGNNGGRPRGEVAKKIIAVLKNRNMTIRMICRDLMIDEMIASYTVSRLKTAGIVSLISRDEHGLAGVYRIVDTVNLGEAMAMMFKPLPTDSELDLGDEVSE